MRIHNEAKSSKKEIALKLFNTDGCISLGVAYEDGGCVVTLISFYGNRATSFAGTKSVLDTLGYDTESLEFDEYDALKVVCDQERFKGN